MKVLKRVTDIFSANLNDLIDHCENPERMLRQAIREMESALNKTMDGAARSIAHERLLSRQLDGEEKSVIQCLETAENAVRAKNDENAKRQLQKKSEHEKLAESLKEQVSRAQLISDQLRNQVSSMRIRLNDAKQKMLEMTARNRAAQARLSFASGFESCLGNSTYSSGFDRIYARIEQEEAEAEAFLELLVEEQSLESTDDKIDAELKLLKEKTGHVSH